MQKTPTSHRLHIGLFGRRNAGKSALLNALTRQEVSIVSDVAGTTTDPVEKPMELLPLGPVLFIDTAGIDDVGALGAARIERTRRVFDRTDVGLVVAQAGQWTGFEQAILEQLRATGTPVIAVFNKADLGEPDPTVRQRLAEAKVPVVLTVATQGRGIGALRQALLASAPEDFVNAPPLVGDLVQPGDLVVLVVPIDMEAPKGRLILPQVQTLRDLLDHDACGLVVKERELRSALAGLNRRPALVITDSQAFLKVSADVPPEVKMTGFSVLMARARGDLCQFVRGAMAIEDLRPGDRVLICEACTHHPIGDDIGRVKIPRWLRQYVGGALHFDHYQGHDFPEDLAGYRLVVHCGGCVHNRRQMLTRQMRCRQAGVPMANYGLTIAYTLGLFERALEPFEAARQVYLEEKARRAAARGQAKTAEDH